MYCQNCGKENEENSKFCLYCGATLMNENNMNSKVNENNVKPKKKKIWIIPLILGVCILLLLFFCLIGGGDNEQTDEIITKLSKLTSVTQEEESFLFSYNDTWVINYNETAQTVKIKEENIYDCISESFESEEIGNDGEFLYNWNENDLFVQVDCEDKEGHVSTINYSLDKEKWTLLVDDEWYDVTDEFQEYLDDYGIADIMKQDVKSFEKDLESAGLSVDDLMVLDYDDIVQYYKNHPEMISEEAKEETSESSESEKTEENEEDNISQNNDSPIGQVISFCQNGDENNSAELQIVDCYQDYDGMLQKDFIVIHVHVKNTGNSDIDIGPADFSMYGNNEILEMSYVERTSLPRAFISPGREVDGTVGFEANNFQLDTVELEFAEMSIPLKNDKINVFEEQLVEDENEDYNSVITAEFVRESLGVPEDADVAILYSEEYYWDAGGITVVDVGIEGSGKDEGHFASAAFDVSTGEMANNIYMWD
ncbi:MAG: zinc-ribbon domain-containing protein [Lachnospiraceae bacterium]|nr:zinc-ribbon domain-containing protein [Lachnospiraceae bacterium]